MNDAHQKLEEGGWLPMGLAPTKGYPIQHVRGILIDGSIVEDMHYACDTSGEDQPPFKGWFIPMGSGGYYGIDPDPVGWMPKKKGGAQ